ncbi:RNA pseudouridylate synthase, putative [Hepatocystis sp. ex Piliocolobus tephrosceles]|nr:RNA pseudouridylate synthase, putative [Hepatocystis sp. ex Piliocolobus tephrosceles]
MFPSVQLKKTTFLRLSKILSLSSVTSRSKAQELIKNGNVKVNNQVLRQNIVVDINSKIEVNNKEIDVDISTKLWGIYKPKHVFCSSEKDYDYEEKKQIALISGYNNDNISKTQNYSNYSKKQLTQHDNNTKNIIIKSITCDKHYDIKNRNMSEQILVVNKKNPLDIYNYDYNNSNINKKKNEKNANFIAVRKKEPLLNTNSNNSDFKKYSRCNYDHNNYKLAINLFDYIRKKNILYEEKNKIINNIPEHLIIVNSLDTLSEGLVLLTNDGDFATKLKDIQNNILTTYIIKVQEELTTYNLDLLKKGCINMDNTYMIRPLNVHIIKHKNCFSTKWLNLTYVERSQTDLNHLFQKYNITIRKCKRYSFGPYIYSDLYKDFIKPLKIHSTLTHLIPKYDTKLTLASPNGNIQINKNNKCVLIKNYLKQSILAK